MLMVNGAAVPAPSEIKVEIENISSGIRRSASGYAMLDRMGKKRVLMLRWAGMSAAELADLMERVGAGGFFEACYPDPESGNMRTMTCCAGDRSTGMLRMENGVPIWKNVEMKWTER